jgi:hypothetical protein
MLLGSLSARLASAVIGITPFRAMIRDLPVAALIHDIMSPMTQYLEAMSRRRIRLYLDTSSIIMMESGQDPRRQAITKDFFRLTAERPK